MKKSIIGLATAFLFILITRGICFAGFTYQDFEPNNGSSQYGWQMGSIMYTWAGFSSGSEPVHSGTRSWKLATDHYTYWAQTGIGSQVNPGNTDLDVNRTDRLCIWVYPLPQWGGNHTLGIRFFDKGLYANDGFEIWTTNTAAYNSWTELHVLFSQLPDDFDLGHITRLVLTMYWPGTYYFDDISVVRQDRAYQTFEPG